MPRVRGRVKATMYEAKRSINLSKNYRYVVIFVSHCINCEATLCTIIILTLKTGCVLPREPSPKLQTAHQLCKCPDPLLLLQKLPLRQLAVHPSRWRLVDRPVQLWQIKTCYASLCFHENARKLIYFVRGINHSTCVYLSFDDCFNQLDQFNTHHDCVENARQAHNTSNQMDVDTAN